MELELIGHQGAKDRSTHSFHVSGIDTSITQGSQELRESPRQAATGGTSPEGSLRTWPSVPHTAAPLGCSLEWTQVEVKGALIATLGSHLREKK